jgi:hypothetical protein
LLRLSRRPAEKVHTVKHTFDKPNVEFKYFPGGGPLKVEYRVT